MNQPKPRRVVHCNKSTIIQAWTALVGAPGPHSQGDRFATVLEWQASKAFDNLRPVPSIVIVPAGEAVIDPHWVRQVTWGEHEQYLARLGERYLSVHFLANPASFTEARYRTFGEDLESTIRQWIESFSEACLGQGPECSKVIFGYMNCFSFPMEHIDISQYFAMDIGLSENVATNGLSRLSATFGLPEDDSKTRLEISIDADSSGESLSVETRVEASLTFTDDLPLMTDAATMLQEIKQVKEAAKKAFFRFATPKTHLLMEATYDTP